MPNFNQAMAGIIESMVRDSEAQHAEAQGWTLLISRLQQDMLILNPRVEDWIDETKAEMDADNASVD